MYYIVCNLVFNGVVIYVSPPLNCEFHEGSDDAYFCHYLLKTQKYLLNELLNGGMND